MRQVICYIASVPATLYILIAMNSLFLCGNVYCDEYILLFSLTFYTTSLTYLYATHKKTEQITGYILCLFIFLCAAQMCNLILDTQHPLLGYTLSSPGSLLSRYLNINISPFLRRILEPSNILLYLSLIYTSKICPNIKKSRLSSLCGLAFIIAIICEGVILANPIHIGKLSTSIIALQIFSKSIIILSLFLASLINYKISTKDVSYLPSNHNSDYTHLIIPILLIAIFYFLGFEKKLSKEQTLQSIHYYVWFPENWNAGYAHKKNLGLTPKLGEYHTNDKEVIKEHINQLKEKNIDIIFLDWWPTKRNLRKRAKVFIKNIPQDSKLKYSVHIETQDLADDNKIIRLDKKNITILNRTVLGLAQKFFSDPRYLEINGKKVINLYTTRHIIGDFPKFIKDLRLLIKKETGHNLYIIGDEAYYNVISSEHDLKLKMLRSSVPDWERIHSLDAITLYNPYDPLKNYGSSAEEKIISLANETKKLYSKYNTISTTAGIPFIPTVIPGYNDTGIRPHYNHPIIERNSEHKKTFNELLEVSKDSTNHLPTKIINITSWNEWNEGTNIEE